MSRPAKWTDPEAFEAEVDKYFDEEPEPTWNGLALHLGFISRESLNYYMKEKPEFLNPIKKALTRIENEYEKGLRGKNPAGSIFALKNFGWKDKQEVENRTTIKDERIDESKLTDDELRVLANIQRKSGISPETL